MRSSSKDHHQSARSHSNPSKLTRKTIEEGYENGQQLYYGSKEISQTYPYSSIGVITVKNQSQTTIKGVGAIISPNLVITDAGNLLYRKQMSSSLQGSKCDLNIQYQVIKFHPGGDGQFKQQESFIVESWRYPIQLAELTYKNQQLHGYAILKLVGSVPRPLGGFLRPASYCFYCLSDKVNEDDLSICGYTLEKSLSYSESLSKESSYLKTFQYGLKAQKRITKIDDKERLILYTVPTLPVQMGSPIIFGDLYLAVHTGSNTQQKLSVGRLFTKELIDQLLKWCQQLKGNPFQAILRYPCRHCEGNKINEQVKKLLQKGNQSQQQKDYKQALAQYINVLKLDPKNCEALKGKGKCLHKMKNYAAAVEQYAKAINIDPQDASAYAERAFAYYRSRDYERCQKDCETALKFDSNNANAYAYKGYMKWSLKRYEQALCDCNRFIQLNCKNQMVYHCRGLIYEELTFSNEALADFTTAIQINPKYINAYINRGKIYANLQDYDKALADYTTAIQINPKFAMIYYNRGFTYKKLNDYDKALADYTTAIQINPKYIEAYNNRGLAYGNLKDYDKALADYTTIIEIDPKYAYAYYNRGYTYYDLKDYDKALADFTTAIKIDPKYTDAYCNRGVTYLNLKEYIKAFSDFIKAITLDQQYETAYHLIFKYFLKRKHLYLSSNEYLNILKAHSKISSLLFKKGTHYKSQNQNQRSLILYELAFHIQINDLYLVSVNTLDDTNIVHL